MATDKPKDKKNKPKPVKPQPASGGTGRPSK